LVLLWLAKAAGQETPESNAHTRVALYQDDDATTVVTSAVEAQAAIKDQLTLRAGGLIDAVSTASVDVVAAATGRWEERRYQGDLASDLILDNVSLGASYGYSTENDYASHRASLRSTLGLAQQTTVLGLSTSVIFSDVGRSGDPSFSREQTIFSVDVSASQVINRETLFALNFSFQTAQGFQSSPYRFVRTRLSGAVPERHPEERYRNALVGQLRHALTETWTAALDQRFYLDSWQMFGTTTRASFTWEASELLELEIHDRLHYQTSASFFRESYQIAQRYMSIDRELSTTLNNFIGGGALLNFGKVGPFEMLTADARADLFIYHFFNYPYLDGRVGTLVSLGLEGVM